MNILDFKTSMEPHAIFSLHDLRKAQPGFSYRQLSRWEQKGYLKKIRRGFYMLSRQTMNELYLYLAANKIYSPSYISLETALAYYQLIPEAVFQITSVSTQKTTRFNTPIGHFYYHHLSPELFWGYRLLRYHNRNICFAQPEKALLDYLYLNPHLKTANDFIEIRINIDSFQKQIDLSRFQTYLQAFENKSLIKRAKIFLKTMRHDFS